MAEKDVWDPEVKVEESSYNYYGEPKHFHPTNNRERSPQKPAIDLFCGAGGISEGLKRAGYDVVLGSDIHLPSLKSFRANNRHAHAILGDMRNVSDSLLKEVADQAAQGRSIELISAGIPCQGFSLASRKRNDEDERNYLFREYVRSVEILEPQYVLLENVSNMETVKDGEFVRDIVEALDGKYKVGTKVLNAKDFGVPQRRKRLIIMGVRDGAPLLWPREDKEERTAWDALSDLPELDKGQKKYGYRVDPENSFQKKMRRGSTKLLNHEAPNHRKTTLERIKNTEPGEPMYETFRQRVRLHPEQPAPTIISGGIRPQFQYGHPTQPRGLTVRERARLQSFPDSFEFKGGIVQGRVQTGQAVPPLLAEALANSIMCSRSVVKFREALLEWFEENGREFPWRKPEKSPYEVLVSEILLRKTRSQKAAEIYPNFLDRFPTLEALNRADKSDIQTILSPLGLQTTRARNFKKIAKNLKNSKGSKIPSDEGELMDLPGVGKYIANAVLCFGFGERRPIVDANVQRVYKYFFNVDAQGQLHSSTYLWEFAESALPEEDFVKYNYALLDFGAMVRTSKVLKEDSGFESQHLEEKRLFKEVLENV